MCTVTIVPTPGLGGTDGDGHGDDNDSLKTNVRIACNRDELGTRPAALPPQELRFGVRRAILPIDPVSDGTWIAVNGAGVALVLLNVNLSLENKTMTSGLRSRGAIIPSLLHCSTLGEAMEAALHLDAPSYSPFRLVLLDRFSATSVTGDGRALAASQCQSLVEPILFTSSGLGDERVEGPRRALFREFFTAHGEDSAARQDEFHLHSWPDRPHLSIRMSRADARTVSRTVIEIGPDEARMNYFAGVDRGVGVTETLRLSLREGSECCATPSLNGSP